MSRDALGKKLSRVKTLLVAHCPPLKVKRVSTLAKWRKLLRGHPKFYTKQTNVSFTDEDLFKILDEMTFPCKIQLVTPIPDSLES